MIDVNGVTITFQPEIPFVMDAKRALHDISFKMEDGCVYGLLGSNGAGKSTLMRAMCGIYRPDEGEVLVDGKNVWNNPEAKENVYFVSDSVAWHEGLTVDGLCEYYKSFRPTFDEATFNRLTEALELPRKQRISKFSKGMRRQAVTIAGVACRTKHLLLDESFDGLDPAMRRVIREILIDELCDNGSSVVLSSHNVGEITEVCDHVLIIHNGELMQAGEIDEIRGNYQKIQLVGSDGNVSPAELEKAGLAVMDLKSMGSVVQAIVRGNEKEVLARAKTLPSVHLAEALPLTLEEVFVYEMREKGYGKYNQEG